MCGRSPIHVKRLHSGSYKGYESTAKKGGISQKLKCDPLFCLTPRSSVTQKGTPALILQQQMPVVSECIWGVVTKRNDPRLLFPARFPRDCQGGSSPCSPTEVGRWRCWKALPSGCISLENLSWNAWSDHPHVLLGHLDNEVFGLCSAKSIEINTFFIQLLCEVGFF